MSSSDIKSLMESVAARARETITLIENDPAAAARIAAVRELDEAAESKRNTNLREAKWEANGIPRRFWPMLHAGATGSDGRPEVSFAVQHVYEFLAEGDKSTILVLAGGVGCGKTVAAAVGCAFHPGKMIKAVDLIRIGMFSEGEDKRTLKELQQAKLAVIDDVGAEPQDTKGYAYAAFFDAVERRYDSALKTILTTNLTLDEFRARYGTGPGLRFWDRIRGDARWVDVPGKSRRERSA